MKLAETLRGVRPADAGAMRRAAARQLTLTKPPGSLGRLEAVAVQLAGIFGSERPARRIAAHRAQRPAAWDTLEEPFDPAAAAAPLLNRYDTVVLDCLTMWVSNLLLRQEDAAAAEPALLDAAGRLLGLIERSPAAWIVVSNEVGLGVVPPSPLGRTYRDALGRVNQLVAARADRVYLLVAGLALELKALGAQPLPAGERRDGV